MTQRFYINSDGTYAGSYDGPDAGNPHAGKVEVPSCPTSSHLVWDGAQWTGQDWNPVRSKRVDLLVEADHLVNIAADAGDAAAEAAARSYRQALRDITNQADPSNPTWPTKPGA